jgi:outer membrane protein OmpA-like peptidoglycan-associated protein
MILNINVNMIRIDSKMKFKVHFIIGLTFFYCSYLFSQCPKGMITSEQNLVINGDFEDAMQNFYTEYEYSKTAGAGRYDIVKDAKQFSPIYFTGTGDNYFMAVDGAEGLNKVVWQQTIKVKQHTTYFFSIWVSSLMEIVTGPPATLQFSINDKLLETPFNCPNVTNKWKQFFTNWNSESNESILIKIVTQNPNPNGNDFGFDRIKFCECILPDFDKQLKEAKIGDEIDLRNIQFETGKSFLLSESFEQLDKLIDYLKNNQSITIEIAGHTDNIGNSISNQKLSENRVISVAEYLSKKGINKNRFEMVGYGEFKPLSTNETIEGRQINRRVTIKILSK